MSEMNPQLDLEEAMLEYASAIRGDWSNFDGRSERDVIEGWVHELRHPDPEHNLAWHRNDLGICPDGNGHWAGRWGHCRVDECPTYAAELAEQEKR